MALRPNLFVTVYTNTLYISFYILQVFAMLASLESAVPILASAIFTNLYNATSELTYPWQGSFYFGCIGFSSIGMAHKMDMDIGHMYC